MAESRELLIATSNRGKLREVRAILHDLPLVFRTLDEFPGVPLAVEDGITFEENAAGKALHYARATQLWTLADDSGLEVDALDGAPGVYSARFAGQQGDDRANNAKLVAQLAGVPPARRTARFRCAAALASPAGLMATSTGSIAGLIVDEPRGSNGFGYDPHFLIPSLGMTSAELPPEVKNEISHRGQALCAIRPKLEHWLIGA